MRIWKWNFRKQAAVLACAVLLDGALLGAAIGVMQPGKTALHIAWAPGADRGSVRTDAGTGGGAGAGAGAGTGGGTGAVHKTGKQVALTFDD